MHNLGVSKGANKKLLSLFSFFCALIRNQNEFLGGRIIKLCNITLHRGSPTARAEQDGDQAKSMGK